MIIDLEDRRYIPSSAMFLLDECTAYFKRELPLDRWQVFMRTDHRNIPTFRYRTKASNRRRIEKLYPLTLGHKLGVEDMFPDKPVDKSCDVFFAGTVVGSSLVRERGLSSLRKLQLMGYRVDIAEYPIPQKEFYHRAASAHLVWSPEGYGWDCFRHYEAAMCWSVPLMNHATIERHMPMRHGDHAFYYHPDTDDLVKIVQSALADRDGLIKMAAAARAHVMNHNLLAPSVRYMIGTTLNRWKSANEKR
ncbi:MAG: glycosyltransferase [Aureliella sp.]